MEIHQTAYDLSGRVIGTIKIGDTMTIDPVEQQYTVSVQHGGHRFFLGSCSTIEQALEKAKDAAKRYSRMRSRSKTGGQWPVVLVWKEVTRFETKPKKEEDTQKC